VVWFGRCYFANLRGVSPFDALPSGAVPPPQRPHISYFPDVGRLSKPRRSGERCVGLNLQPPLALSVALNHRSVDE